MPDSNSIALSDKKHRILAAISRALFLILFLIGSIGIIALKTLGFSQLSVTAFPIACMLFYLAFVLLSSKYFPLDDRSADNLYYLGLLFTLVSLAYALYEFSFKEHTTETVVQNFGIALSTTILGLASRVLLMQLYQDYSHAEKVAREGVIRAAQAFRDELNAVIIDLNAFRRSSVQSTKDAVREITEATTKSLTESLDHLSANLNEILNKIEVAVDTHIRAFQEIAVDSASQLEKSISQCEETLSNAFFEIKSTLESSKEITKQLNRSSRSIVSSAEKLLERISNIQAPSDLLETKFQGVFDVLSESIKEILEVNKAYIEQQGTLSKELLSALSNVENLNKQLVAFSELAPVLQNATKSVTETANLFSSFNTFVKDHLQKFENLPPLLERDIEIVKRHRMELDKELGKSRKTIAEIQDSLSSLVTVIVEKLGND